MKTRYESELDTSATKLREVDIFVWLFFLCMTGLLLAVQVKSSFEVHNEPVSSQEDTGTTSSTSENEFGFPGPMYTYPAR